MSSTRTCRRCGAALTASTPEGFCPRCMLAGALEPFSEEENFGEDVPVGSEPCAGTAGGAAVRCFGAYELIAELGRGGMGVVYKARQRSLNRIVALKMILAQRLASEAMVQRFRLEAEAAASLRHPNIVATHEVGEIAGQHFFSMEFIEGRNLAEVISDLRFPISDFRRVARWVKTIAEAVHYAHQHGILHRDLKPSNILVDSDDEPHVTDFGLARRLETESTITVTGEVIGSPAYMAPEQARGDRHVTVSTDVYSLGGILYELLTGRPSFSGASAAETLHQTLHAEPAPARTLNPAVPRDLETICLKCLEKEPARRYNSAQEVAEELGRFLRDEPISARPAGPSEKLWRWARRNRVVAGLSAAAILTFIFGLTGISWQWHRAVTARKEAEVATRAKQEQLWQSQLIEARYHRTSGQPGQQTKSLNVIGEAAKWRPSIELRNEAIAALLLPDLDTNVWFRNQPDASYYFACDADFEHYVPYNPAGRIEVRRTRDHAVVASFKGLSPLNKWSQFSPDGRRLAVYFASEGTNSQVGLWDWRTGQRLLNVVNALNFASRPVFDFTPDGRELVVASGSGPLRRFGVENGRELQPPALSVRADGVRVSPSGRVMAIHFRREVQVWSLTRSQQVARCALPSGMEDMAWHPHEELLAIATGAGLFLWKTSAKDPDLISTPNHITRVFFNPDGDLLLAGGWDNSCGIWDAETGRPLLSYRDGAPVQMSRDGGSLAYVRERIGIGARRFLLPRGLRRLLVPGSHSGNHGAFDAQFHPNGRWLLSAHHQGWLLWDSISARIVGRHRGGRVNRARFLPDGSAFITCGHDGVQRWPLSSMESERPRVAEPEMLIASERFQFDGIALAPDGTRFAAASPGTSLVCQIDGSSVVRLAGSERRPAHHVHFSPDGRWVMTGHHHGTHLSVYDAASGQHVRDLPSGGGYGVFQPDGQCVLGLGPRDYTFWRVGTWELVRRIPWGDAGLNFSSSGFSPDGRYFLINDLEAHVRFRDAATDRDFATFISANTAAGSLCFDSSGKRLVVNSSLTELFLWDLAELRRELGRLGLDWPEEHPGEGFTPRQARP